MTLLDRLREVGSRLRIFEARPAAARPRAPKLATRSVTLADLTTEIRAEEVRALADLPAELAVGFDRIYEAAGIRAPAHGWDAGRLAQAVAGDAVKGQARAAVQKSILARLAAEGVAVEDLVRDVIARDQALDAFERFVRSKMDDRSAARQRKIAELEAQAAALRDECERLRLESEADQKRWGEWRARKRAAERDLTDTVGYLIDRAVVTIDDDD